MSAKPIRLAIVSNSVTPYRVHLHKRIAEEVPDVELWSIFTHEHSNAPWQLKTPDSIRPVCFGNGDFSEDQGILRDPYRAWRKGARIVRWLNEHRIDCVILFGYNDLCLLRLAGWCHSSGIPCFLFGDSNILGDRAAGFRKLLKQIFLPLMLKRCTGVMYCGRRGAEYFMKYGVQESRLFPFPYEPDYERLSRPLVGAAQHSGANPRLAPGRRRLLYCGRLVDSKRVDLLIDAFNDIASERPEWDVVIAGGGPLQEALSHRVAAHLRHRVAFLGFINCPDLVAEVYAKCDVLVLPSDYEPWGVVVSEAAMSLALVCSSAVGAAGDLLHDRENGMMFNAGELPSLVTALREVTLPDQVDRMKSESPKILASWRQKSDPVRGLLGALDYANLGSCC